MKSNYTSVAFVLYVRDVDRTEQFYARHLGIEFTRNPGDDGSSWLLAKVTPDVEMLVFPGDPKPGNTPAIVFGLASGGIESTVASLAAAGIEIVSPVSEAPGGWSAEFKDPDGHTLSFFQDAALPKTIAR
jgi:glyoxylase I family protein